MVLGFKKKKEATAMPASARVELKYGPLAIMKGESPNLVTYGIFSHSTKHL
jgi:hypothetical protein